jgi:hypothetical protein
MSRFWSRLTHDLRPYVPGEQPRVVALVKLNTNESPLGPSPRALEAVRGEASDTLRLYPTRPSTRSWMTGSMPCGVISRVARVIGNLKRRRPALPGFK